MALAEPVQPTTDRRAMHAQAMHRRHLRRDLVQRQVTPDRQPVPQPPIKRRKLARTAPAKRLRRKPTTLPLQDHHVVHKARRHPEMSRRLAVSVPLLDKRNNPAPQLDRVWPAHHDPPYLAGSVNQNVPNNGILNRQKRDLL